MKGIACGFALWLTAGPALAQSMGDAAARERQRRDSVRAAAWQEFRNPAGDFKVLFPYEPMKKREHIPGLPTLMDTYVAAKEKRSYFVRVGELPADVAKRPADVTLDEVRDGMLKGAEGQLEGERKIGLGTRVGRAYTLRMKDRLGEEMLLSVRSFVSGSRVLLVAAGAAAEDKDSALADRFFASFTILR